MYDGSRHSYLPRSAGDNPDYLQNIVVPWAQARLNEGDQSVAVVLANFLERDLRRTQLRKGGPPRTFANQAENNMATQRYNLT